MNTEKTAYSYTLRFLHNKEKNFLQSLLTGEENLPWKSTEINHSRTWCHSSPKANDSEKHPCHSELPALKSCFQKNTAFPTGAEKCSVTSIVCSFELKHLIGSGTNCLAGPRVFLVPKSPTCTQCANDRNKCYNPTPWSSRQLSTH